MDYYAIAVTLIVLAAIFGYVNVRFLKLPNTIGLMLISILFSLGLMAVDTQFKGIAEWEKDLVSQIDFRTLLMEGMLSFLLFAPGKDSHESTFDASHIVPLNHEE